MTTYQKQVVNQLQALGRTFGLSLEFEDKGLHAIAWFEWNDDSAGIIVGDGELIFEFDGEYYFETPDDPSHAKVRQFIEFVALCLQGVSPQAARKQATAS